MKIIEAMKKIKDLTRKAEDLRNLIKQYHVDMDAEAPTYGTVEEQRKQISSWLQSHSDIIKEIGSLRYKIQKTNINTIVAVELDGKAIRKTIAEWIHRRKDLANLELTAWSALNDRGLPASGRAQKSSGETYEVKIRRYYDPKERDQKKTTYASEPLTIDGCLEIANATTDLME